ncbi:MAG: KilA-N protein, partial [Gemmataceae bacterium]|nr:KilA-N protein [Gemmataceae bacterium]
ASSTVHCTSRPAGRLLQYSKTWNHASDYFGVRIGPATVRVRRADGYFDATAICQAYGARWWDFGRTSRAQAVITRIAERNGIPELATISTGDATETHFCVSVPTTETHFCVSVVEVYRGAPTGNGRGAGQGTWIHSDLVLALVDWCVPGTVIDAAGRLRQLWLEQVAADVPVRSRPVRRSPPVEMAFVPQSSGRWSRTQIRGEAVDLTVDTRNTPAGREQHAAAASP